MAEVSKLVQEIQSRRPSDMKQRCRLTRIKETMTDEERESIEKAEEAIRLDNGNGRTKTFSAKWLSEVLSKCGYQISDSTIMRHINGRCGCE
jgi:hypothetical protein